MAIENEPSQKADTSSISSSASSPENSSEGSSASSQGTGLLPAYLAVGEDALKQQHVIERLRKRIASLGDLSLNENTFSTDQAQAADIINACNTMPFLSECRLVFVKDAQNLDKASSEAIIKYLDNPSDTTVLLLSAKTLKKTTRLYKAFARLDKKAIIECGAKTKRDLPSYIRNLATGHQSTISAQAANELLARKGEDTVCLDAEVKKLVSIVGKGKTIEIEDVKRYCARTSEVKPWELADALANKDSKQAFVLLSLMPSQSLFGLLPLCMKRIREMIKVKDLGANPSSAAIAQMLGKPEWMVKNYPAQCSNFTLAQLTDILIEACELEEKMKSGFDQQKAFELWLGRACMAK